MWGLRCLTFGLPWVAMASIENNFLEPKAFLMTAIGWLLIFWQLFNRPVAPNAGWRNPLTFWVIGWITAVSLYKFQWLFMNRVPGQSNLIYNHFVWLACCNVIMAALLAHSLATGYLRLDRNLHQLTEWMCVSAALVAGYGIFQALGFDQWYQTNGLGQTDILVYAGFGNPGYLAIYLAVIFPLFFIFSPKRYMAYAAISLITILLTKTYYALAIAAIGLGSSLLARWWARITVWAKGLSLAGCAASAYGMAFYGYHHLLQDERLGIWAKAIGKLHTNAKARTPSMTGYGLDSFPILMGMELQWAHNEWVQMSVEIGIIGCLLVLAMVVYSSVSGWKASQESILSSGWFGVWTAFLASTLIHFPAHIAPIAWIGLCAWAVMERNTGEVNG